MAALTLSLAVTAAACGNADDSQGSGGGGGDDKTKLSGSISGDGSSTVFPITEAVAEEFQKENPEVQVTVGVSGTGGGFKKFCNDETDIQDASRPVKDEEKAACAAKGVKYVELTVANDGLAVVANPENTWTKCLTVEQLKTIWEPAAQGKVTKWNQVDPGFPDKELKLYGPGTDSGTFDYFTDEVNGEEGASRSDYTASEDDNTLVQGVEGDEGALGYFGYAYYKENKDKLKLLGVNGGSGCVKPSDETVKSGEYKPLSRPLFVYVKESALGRPEVKAFVQFYLDNANTLVGDVGYTPLDNEALNAEKSELDEAAGGQGG